MLGRALNQRLDAFLGSYGDLLYDICTSVCQRPAQAQSLFRSILKDVRREHLTRTESPFSRFERAWILKIAVRRIRDRLPFVPDLLESAGHHGGDNAAGVSQKLKNLFVHLSKLPRDERILLVLRDKHQIPMEEISIAMERPVGSLEFDRQQALKRLASEIWSDA